MPGSFAFKNTFDHLHIRQSFLAPAVDALHLVLSIPDLRDLLRGGALVAILGAVALAGLVLRVAALAIIRQRNLGHGRRAFRLLVVLVHEVVVAVLADLIREK